MWDKTYTMMFTDHGEYLGDYGLIEKFPCGVEEVLCRDPLIIAGPGLPGSQKSDVLCEMVDLTPTVLDLLGVEERYPHSGISLVGAMKGEHLQDRADCRSSKGAQAIRFYRRRFPGKGRTAAGAVGIPVRQEGDDSAQVY
jgi:arylsulfatase A-like enzyme